MNKDSIIQEAAYKAVRSSGAGGQNVNKVSSKVVLSFNPAESSGLTEEEKARIAEKLGSRLNKEGVLQLQCDEDRSQVRNKELVTRRFIRIIEEALILEKPRLATKVPKAVIKRRIENKRRQSDKKQSRNKPDY